MQQQVLSVAQLNEYIKMQMDNDLLLSSVLIRGDYHFVIQSEAKDLEYIKWMLPRSFTTFRMTL